MTALTVAAGQLAGVLQEESSLCTRLLEVTDREQTAIVASDVEGLTALVDEKERLLELLGALETERMTALAAIAIAAGTIADDLTLSTVADLAAPEMRAQLIAAGEDLRVTGIALSVANARNAHLLESSAELVERWLQYLKTVITNTLTYSPDGNARGPQGNRVIDRSA